MFRFFNVAVYALSFFLLIGCSTTVIRRRSLRLPSESKPISEVQSASNSTRSEQKSSKVDDNLFDETRIHLPIVRNASVEKWVHYFQTKAHRSFLGWTARGEAFRPSVESVLLEKGVPAEFYYVSLIESGFVLHATSPRKAVGPWQIVQDTGERYGLKVNDWVDQRRDPVRSTYAAANLFKNLYIRYNDWYLVLAAYNGGPRRVDEAIKKGGTRDYWELVRRGFLKKETADFVPKLLAAVIVGSDPLNFGFPAKVMQASQSFPEGMIRIQRPVHLDELAKKLGVSTRNLREWNPELLRSITPPKRAVGREAYALRVPTTLVPIFARVEPKLQYLQFQDVRMHKVAKGDTIAKLAKRYHVSVQTVLQINPQLSSRGMVVGMKLAIPEGGHPERNGV